MALTQTLVLTLLFSLVIWAFFFIFGAPLTSAESFVVVGICALTVGLVRTLTRRIRRQSHDKAP